VKKNTRKFFVKVTIQHGEVGEADHDEFIQDWLGAVDSEDVAEFEVKFAALEAKYVAGRQPLAIAYLKAQLYPKAAKFVRGACGPFLPTCPLPPPPPPSPSPSPYWRLFSHHLVPLLPSPFLSWQGW
jgi:hypothetical protein